MVLKIPSHKQCEIGHLYLVEEVILRLDIWTLVLAPPNNFVGQSCSVILAQKTEFKSQVLEKRKQLINYLREEKKHILGKSLVAAFE